MGGNGFLTWQSKEVQDTTVQETQARQSGTRATQVPAMEQGKEASMAMSMESAKGKHGQRKAGGGGEPRRSID